MDNREAIKKTIEKIAQLSKQPGNEWLLRELQSKWGCNSTSNGNSDSISNIERYLAIDYTIDEISSQIDYSFVQDEVLRIKLVSDWREMLRYRCSVRKHKPDFLEFCRYANLQAEGVVNYYCNVKYKNENGIRKACGLDEKANITYSNKLYLLKGFVPYSLRNNLYEKLYQARNIQSHRAVGSSKEHPWIQEQIKMSGLPIYKVGENLFINRYKCTFTEKLTYEEKYKLFLDNLKVAGVDYFTYEVKIWAASAPYDEVESTLGQLVEKIRENISK